MQPVAKVGDIVATGGVLTLGSTTVFVNNIPAALYGSPVTSHGCCGSIGCDAHCAAVVSTGSTGVFVNNIPSLRIGDIATCGDPIVSGSPNVFFG